MVLLRLGLVRKKVLLFVNSINEGFRLRLFLEAFGIRSAVLNAELPLNSRHHILQVQITNEAVFLLSLINIFSTILSQCRRLSLHCAAEYGYHKYRESALRQPVSIQFCSEFCFQLVQPLASHARMLGSCGVPLTHLVSMTEVKHAFACRSSIKASLTTS